MHLFKMFLFTLLLLGPMSLSAQNLSHHQREASFVKSKEALIDKIESRVIYPTYRSRDN